MSISYSSILKRKTACKNRVLLSLTLLGLLPTIWVVSPIVKTKLMPDPYAYPYDLSPSGGIRKSLIAEITAVEARVQQNPNDGLDRAILAETYLKIYALPISLQSKRGKRM